MTDRQIIDAMVQFGGSFAQALGHAALCADANNLARIKTSFSDLWQQYEELAQLNVRNLARIDAEFTRTKRRFTP